MKAETLRKSILQYAIQGKLVPQIDSEEPASELLQKIKAEKDTLIKQGKIKEPKPLPPITEDEKPFEIPDSWEWVRLQALVYNHGQKQPDIKFSYIDISSIDNSNQTLAEKENIVEPENAPSRARKIIHQGDILYATVRPYLHNICVIDKKFSEEPIASTGFAVLCPFSQISTNFLFYYLLSPIFDLYANDTENSKGVAYPAINDTKLYNSVIALPPLEEQKRIVARIEELMLLVDEYEKKQIELEKLEKEFPEKLTKSVLQYAIQGKLVPQIDTEEPASELLKKIKAEKDELIKQGKIKEPKPLPPITEEEKPFEIPDSWEWVRLETLCKKIGSGSTPNGGKKVYVKSGIKFLREQNVQNYGLKLDNVAFITEEMNRKKLGSVVNALDLLLNITGASIGRCALVPTSFDIGNINQHILILRLIDQETCDFILRCIHSPYTQDLIMEKQVGAKEGLSATKAKNFPIPFPPLEEQKRIASRVEELFKLVDLLSSDKKSKMIVTKEEKAIV